jgi:ornithine--oxo-acid transaminase
MFCNAKNWARARCILANRFARSCARELAGFDMVNEVRGMGLLNGIEFVPPKKLAFRALYETFHRIHPAMFGQIVVMRMFREKGILTQICGNNFMVLKAAPPLMVTSAQLDEFVEGIRDVVEMAQTSPTFWTEALGMVRRAVNI